MARKGGAKASVKSAGAAGLNQRGDRQRVGRGDRLIPRGAEPDRRDRARRQEPERVRAARGQERQDKHLTAIGLGDRSDRSRAARRVSTEQRPGAQKRAFESRAGRTPKKNAVSNPGQRR